MILERTLKANSINSENKFSNVELRRETSSSAEDFNERHLSSSSKYDRNAMIVQSERNQRISMTGTEEVVLRRIKKEQTNENKEETGNSSKKQAANKISSTFKNAIESSILRKYGAVMIYQW